MHGGLFLAFSGGTVSPRGEFKSGSMYCKTVYISVLSWHVGCCSWQLSFLQGMDRVTGLGGVLAYFAVFDESSILRFHCLSLAALQYSTTQSGVCGKWFGWKVIWELDGCEYCRFGTDAVP